MAKTQKIAVALALALGLAFAGTLGTARPAAALTISPPSIEFAVQPGNQAEFIVKLYNEGADKLTYYMDATTFGVGTEEGVPNYNFAAPKEDIATWVKLDKQPIVLEPQGRKEVTVVVDIPADAAPGGHYGIVAFTATPPVVEGQEKPQVAVSQGIGTLLFVRVEGEVVESATVTQFAPSATKYNHLPVSFTTVYKNTGNIHLKPSGTVTITSMSKKTVATLEVNQTKTSALPNSSRTYTTTWGSADTVQTTATNAWAKFWESYRNERANYGFGKYTATLALKAGQSGGVTSSSAVTFWVFPWHVFLVWAVGVVLLIILLIILVKRYNTWVIRKAQSGGQNPPTTQAPPAAKR